jgi:hypothetical protein
MGAFTIQSDSGGRMLDRAVDILITDDSATDLLSALPVP